MLKAGSEAIPASSKNLAQSVIRHIYQIIKSEELKDGDKLPTNRELAASLNVSILTIQRAMKQLEASGTVACHRRKGTFLVNSAAIENPRINSDLIGLFLPEAFTDFHMELALEVEKGLTENGKLLSINFTHSQPDKELLLLRTLARQRLEALVYFTSPLVAGSERLSKAVGAWVDRYIHEGTFVIFVDLAPEGYENRLITLDNEAAGRMLTKELIEKGHKHIAFVGTTHLGSGRGRSRGYMEAMDEAGLSYTDDHLIQARIIETGVEERLTKQVAQFLALYPETTGFVVDNQGAAEIVKKVIEEFADGESDPSTSIASIFENESPPFDAVAWIHVPGTEMGKKAVEAVTQSSTTNRSPGHIMIPPVLWEPHASKTGIGTLA